MVFCASITPHSCFLLIFVGFGLALGLAVGTGLYIIGGYMLPFVTLGTVQRWTSVGAICVLSSPLFMYLIPKEFAFHKEEDKMIEKESSDEEDDPRKIWRYV